jgi:hypothetical protein
VNKDSALMRGVRTAIQAAVGLVVGLVTTVWAVPGVPQAVTNYAGQHWLQLAVAVGVPSGVAGFVWNALRKDVPNV